MLAKKLQALKCDMNNKVFGNVSTRKDVALEQLNHWNNLEGLRPFSWEETNTVTSPSLKKLPRGRNQGLNGQKKEKKIQSSFIT